MAYQIIGEFVNEADEHEIRISQMDGAGITLGGACSVNWTGEPPGGESVNWTNLNPTVDHATFQNTLNTKNVIIKYEDLTAGLSAIKSVIANGYFSVSLPAVYGQQYGDGNSVNWT